MDLMREQGSDARDPRSKPDTWPCYGKHKESRMTGNQHGSWSECTICALRIRYIPKIGASAKYTESHNPANVVEALTLARERFPEGPVAKEVKALIKIVAAQKQLQRARSYQANSAKGKRNIAPEAEEQHDGYTKVDPSASVKA